MMLMMLAMLQAASGTVLRPGPAATQGETVVVTARDRARSKAALEACLRRKCPPKEDIAASIAYAEDQFIGGDYEDSWVTLRRSRGRNDRYAGTLPREVAGLRQFSADLASVLGDPDMARVGTIDALSALKHGSGAKNAAERENKRLEVGDAFVRQSTEEAGVDLPLRSKFAMAVHTYDSVATRAAGAGMGDVQGRAMLRSASLYAQLAGGRSMYRAEAERRIAALRATTDPAMQRYRDAAGVLAARMAYDRGDHAPLERLLADNPVRTRQPMLVMAPRIDLDLISMCGGVGTGLGSYDLRDQWIDYDFTVTPDGRVADVAERRRGKHAGGTWIDEARRSLVGRRYLPLALADGEEGLARVERFVLVSDRAITTGTRIASSCGVPTVLTVDLTAAEPARGAS